MRQHQPRPQQAAGRGAQEDDRPFAADRVPADNGQRGAGELQAECAQPDPALVAVHALQHMRDAEHADAAREPAEHRGQQHGRGNGQQDAPAGGQRFEVFGPATGQDFALRALDQQPEQHDDAAGQQPGDQSQHRERQQGAGSRHADTRIVEAVGGPLAQGCKKGDVHLPHDNAAGSTVTWVVSV